MLKACTAADMGSAPDIESWPSIHCQFFDCVVRYLAPDEKSIDRIKYVFRHFLVDNKCQINLEIALWSDGEFIESLFHPEHEAKVFYRVPGTSQWQSWPSFDTPFPPLQITPLQGRFLAVHGADSEAIGFIAPSLAGKTTLMTKLCYRGYKCLSDDLLFICRQTLRLSRYPKPVGIREGMFKLFPGINRSGALQSAPLFEGVNSGQKTWLVHLDDLIEDCYSENEWVNIKALVITDRTSNAKLQRVSNDAGIASILTQVVSSGCIYSEVADSASRLFKDCRVYSLGTSDIEQAVLQAETLLTQSREELF